MALLLKNVQTYKSSNFSTTFTASRVAWVAKERDNTVELPFGGFLRHFFLDGTYQCVSLCPIISLGHKLSEHVARMGGQ